MSLLCDKQWNLKYTLDDGDLGSIFYVPALECAVRYDRLTVTELGSGDYACQAPGMAKPVRVTTRQEYFDDHSDSMELWSPGSPASRSHA